jgi:hypothetical protein
MAYGDHVKYRDERTGQYRKARNWEKNRNFQVDTLSEGIANFAFKSANRMAEIAGEFAEDLLNYARDNAPWDDRTGDARRGLEYEVSLYNESLEVDLFHTVEYGIWLEVRWGGKYAIIIPSVEAMGPKLFDKMNDIFGDIIYYD